MDKMKYIICLDGSKYNEMYKFMFNELENKSEVKFVEDVPKIGMLKKILLKRKIQKITHGWFDFLVIEKNQLFETLQRISNKRDKIYVILLNAALHYNHYLAGTLNSYRKKWPQLKYILLYLDIVDSGVCDNANYLRKTGVFDLVYTIDQKDVLAIDALLCTTPYSIVVKYSEIQMTSDLYFCGASKKEDIFWRSVCIYLG
jgi:hypothetical protein